MDSPAQQHVPAPQRRLRPSTVRAHVHRAVERIAAEPERWMEVLFCTREALGLSAVPQRVSLSGVRFLDADGLARPALLPLEQPKRLGGAALNEVMESRDLFCEREVIVRTPAEEGETTSAAAVAWRNERMGRVQAHLRDLPHHPAIPRLLASGEFQRGDGTRQRCELYEKAPGHSLRRYAAEYGLTQRELLDVLWFAAGGLQHLQHHGLVHGDVKPENLCVARVRHAPFGVATQRLAVHLIDFDTVSTPDELLAEVKVGTTLTGTLPYMPPENFQQSVPSDPDEARRMAEAKDVFGLGLSAVRLLLGKLPDALEAEDLSDVYEFKQASSELEFALPPETDPALAALLREMVRADWRARPTIGEVRAQLQALRATEGVAARTPQLVPAGAQHWPSTEVRLQEGADRIDPYVVVERAFAIRDDYTPLAKLQDEFGRRLVGVPFTFTSQPEAQRFFDDRSALLADLNRIRARHPGLFPGTFRDLVLQHVDTPTEAWCVWLVRPFLSGKRSLSEYLEECDPPPTRSERLEILSRITASLAALEEAGFRHAGVTTENVFFVPRLHLAAGNGDLGALRFHQELMEMASVRRHDPADPTPDRCVDDLQRLAAYLGVDAKDGWRELPDWQARTAWLRGMIDLERPAPIGG